MDTRHSPDYLISKPSYDPSLNYPMTPSHPPAVSKGLHHAPYPQPFFIFSKVQSSHSLLLLLGSALAKPCACVQAAPAS